MFGYISRRVPRTNFTTVRRRQVSVHCLFTLLNNALNSEKRPAFGRPSSDRIDVPRTRSARRDDFNEPSAVAVRARADDTQNSKRAPFSVQPPAKPALATRCPPSAPLEESLVTRCPPSAPLEESLVTRCPPSAPLDESLVTRCPPSAPLEESLVGRQHARHPQARTNTPASTQLSIIKN